jgi:alanine dehydrogenase
MGRLLVLSASEVERLTDLDDLADALRAALVAIAEGQVSVPPRIAARAPNGLLGAMPGYLPGSGLGAKLVTVFPSNAGSGTPSHQAVIVLFDPESGASVALLDGTYVTAMRTAMTAAVAAKAVARPDSSRIAVLGSGVQAARHVEAFRHLFPGAELRVAARSERAARAIVAASPGAERAPTFEEAVRGADVVCCCTDAHHAVIEDRWLADGAHVSSVGTRREVPPDTVDRAECFAESPAAVLPPLSGTPEFEGRDPASVSLVGAVLNGSHPGRSGPAAITLYKSMGHAAEDLAMASLVVDRARESQAGLTFEL